MNSQSINHNILLITQPTFTFMRVDAICIYPKDININVLAGKCYSSKDITTKNKTIYVRSSEHKDFPAKIMKDHSPFEDFPIGTSE